MEEFKTRLMEEAIELRSRLTLIYNFINGDNKVYKKLPFKIKCYIRIQCFAMMLYNKYLKKRMDWLEITNEHLDDFYVEETARKYLQNLKAKNYDKIVNNERKKQENINGN